MLGFKQFLREMPHKIDVAKTHTRDGDNAKIKKAGRVKGAGVTYKRLGSNDTHHFYRSNYDGHETLYGKEYSQIHVARKDSGEVDFHVSGDGSHEKKSFAVDNVTSNLDKDKNFKYHHVIHHLVNNGHVKKWISDGDHSKGSIATYRKLSSHPDLTMHHEDEFTQKETKVTPKNFDSLYGTDGKFIVRKKKK